MSNISTTTGVRAEKNNPQPRLINIQEGRKESFKLERWVILARMFSALFTGVLIYIIRDSIPPRSLFVVGVIVITLAIHALGAGVVLFFFNRAQSPPKPLLFQFISSTLDVLTITFCLWGLGGVASFKVPAFLGYFLFIAVATFRYSTALTLYTALLAAVNYILLFVYFAATEVITLGSMGEEFRSEAVSIPSVVMRIFFMMLTALALILTARGYARITHRVVKAETDSERDRQQSFNVRSVLMRYFTKDVAEHILETKSELLGERKEVAVMFCDFRDFTRMSSQLSPEKTVAILNGYLSKMVEIVFKYGGTLDKFTGDGFMAVFGAPLSKGDDTYNAARAASEIQKLIPRLNFIHRTDIPSSLKIGIGISSGEVVAGNIGSKERMDYTVIGEPVNMAARLEKLNKKLKTTILLSGETHQKIKEYITAENLGSHEIRGIKRPVNVHQLLDIASFQENDG